MKKHLFLFITIIVFSFILASCGSTNKNVLNENNVTPTENEVVDIEQDYAEVESAVAAYEPEIVELSNEEIEEIVAHTYSKILVTPENSAISFQEVIQDDLRNSPVSADDIFIHGLDPESELYQTIYDFFNPAMQQYVTESGMDFILADRLLLHLNPRNETVLSPTFNQFEVLNKSEDEFVVKHWFETDVTEIAYEATFVLEDDTWKFSGLSYISK